MPHTTNLAEAIAAQFQLRNEVSARFVPQHSDLLAQTCAEMSRRFLRGGRLLAFGRGADATDAQHIAVEFIHPIIVGKRALPAVDLSFSASEALPVLVQPDDIVMAFASQEQGGSFSRQLAAAAEMGALTCQWPGFLRESPLPACSTDPFIQQEMTEVMYHTLWETVHVFLERQKNDHNAGASAFLYPFLSPQDHAPDHLLTDVASSICAKAADDERLRNDVAERFGDVLAAAARAIVDCVETGGALLTFGNGGSATDANDFMIDCLAPPAGMKPIPAISLSQGSAELSGIANDVGVELMFLRQLIAQARPGDMAIAISTSGKSKNICAALVEARRRGLITMAFLGYDGGDVVRDHLADYAFVVPSDYIPRIQEVQASLYHVLRWAVGELK